MLTDIRVRSSKPTERPRKLFDARGLSLHVMPNGGRYWRFDYIFDGKRRTLAKGIYPDVSLAKARARHQKASETLADGIAPNLEKKETSKLFEVVARESRWAEFDFEERRWDLPAERMKMRTPHIVALSTQAKVTLHRLRQISFDQELVFSGDIDPRKPMSNNTILFALYRLGYRSKMTGHGFRGVASTILHEQGWPHEHIEIQLAHQQRSAVSAAYNHALYLGPRAKMMQAWADHLDAIRTEKPTKLTDHT
jgi:Arm DNA-binding domain/Phage integrase family